MFLCARSVSDRGEGTEDRVWGLTEGNKANKVKYKEEELRRDKSSGGQRGGASAEEVQREE